MTTAPAQAPSPTLAAKRAPSRLRFAGFVTLFVYPLVTALQMMVFPLTEGWPLLARNAVFVPLMVTCMIWGVIPFIQTRLHRFL